MPGGGGGTPRWAAWHPFLYGAMFGLAGFAGGLFVFSRHGDITPKALMTAIIIGLVCLGLGVISGFLRRLYAGS